MLYSYVAIKHFLSEVFLCSLGRVEKAYHLSFGWGCAVQAFELRPYFRPEIILTFNTLFQTQYPVLKARLNGCSINQHSQHCWTQHVGQCWIVLGALVFLKTKPTPSNMLDRYQGLRIVCDRWALGTRYHAIAFCFQNKKWRLNCAFLN